MPDTSDTPGVDQAADTVSLPVSEKVNDDAFLAGHVEAIRTLVGRTQSQIIEVGRRLAECKERIGHGNWLVWLDREFGWSADTAENFIHVHEMSKSRNFRDLSLPLSALYLLARPSTPEAARTEVLESAKAGNPVAVTDVKRTIAAHKPPKPTATPPPEVPKEEQKAEIAAKPAILPEDNALSGFTAVVLELLRVTCKQPAERFAGTAVGARDLARLGKFLGDLATILDGGDAPTPPTGANGRDVATEPSVEPPASEASDVSVAHEVHEDTTVSTWGPPAPTKVAELIATFPSDGSIPFFLLRTPPEPPSNPPQTPDTVTDTVSPSQEQTVEIERVPSDVPPIPIPAPPAPTPPAPPPSTVVRTAASLPKVSSHYLPAHRDPWPKNWKTLHANELEQVIRKTQEFGVNHQLEDRHHAQLKKMRERLVVLRQADRAERPQTAAEARP